MSGTLQVERVLAAPPKEVWETLVEPAAASRWMEAKDFQPVVGHRFTARLPRGPNFDGIVQAEVLELDPPRSLRLWWSGGPVSGEVRIALDATEGGGTRIRIEQTGFDQLRQSTLAPALAMLWGQRLEGPLAKALGLGAATGATLGLSSVVAFLGVFVGVAALVTVLVFGLAVYSVSPPVAASQPPPSTVAPGILAPRNTQLNTTENEGRPSTLDVEPDSVERLQLPVQVASPLAPGVIPSGPPELLPVTSPNDATNPSFDATGRYLVGHARGADTGSLYVLDRDRGTSTTVPLAGWSPGRIAWHPQGVALFASAPPGSPQRIRFFQPGGSAPADTFPATRLPGAMSDPAISPRGDALAFTTHAWGTDDVAVWDRSSDVIMRVTESTANEHSPAFSPNGVDLVLVRDTVFGADLQVVNLRTHEGRTLPAPQPAFLVQGPVYAGPNRILAFAEHEGHWSIVSYENEVPKHIVTDIAPPVDGQAPAVSPDGRLVAWLDVMSREGWVFVASVDLPHRAIPFKFPSLSDIQEPVLAQDEDYLYIGFSAVDISGARGMHIARIPW